MGRGLVYIKDTVEAKRTNRKGLTMEYQDAREEIALMIEDNIHDIWDGMDESKQNEYADIAITKGIDDAVDAFEHWCTT
jgi:c-di-AMP phosphodiesterase-like protein